MHFVGRERDEKSRAVSGWHRFLRTNSINGIVWEIDGSETLGNGTRIASGSVHELASTMFSDMLKNVFTVVSVVYLITLL